VAGATTPAMPTAMASTAMTTTTVSTATMPTTMAATAIPAAHANIHIDARIGPHIGCGCRACIRAGARKRPCSSPGAGQVQTAKDTRRTAASTAIINR
jgi:hypothetical protein